MSLSGGSLNCDQRNHFHIHQESGEFIKSSDTSVFGVFIRWVFPPWIPKSHHDDPFKCVFKDDQAHNQVIGDDRAHQKDLWKAF